MGYQKSPQECKEKLESIQNHYKQGIDGGHHNIMGVVDHNHHHHHHHHHQSKAEVDFSSEGGHARSHNDVIDGITNASGTSHLNLMPSLPNAVAGTTANQLADSGNQLHHHHHKQYMSIPYISSTKRSRETDSLSDDDDNPRADSGFDEEDRLHNDPTRSSSSSMIHPWIPSKRFFHKLSRQIIERQEDLHRAFLEAIEVKERERTMREEAYRRQEAARLNREHDIRAQEIAITAARDAALLAFLEKATSAHGANVRTGADQHGHNIRHISMQSVVNPSAAGTGHMAGGNSHAATSAHVSVSSAEPSMQHTIGSSHMIALHGGSTAGGAYHASALHSAAVNFAGPGAGSLDIQHHLQQQQHHESMSNNSCFNHSNMSMDPNSSCPGGDLSSMNTRRWPKAEVHALIRLRSGMEPRFREAGPKAHLWQEISASMACLGFIRSPKRCKEKWENINKYFKKTKDSSKKRPENAKTCPYFHQLDTLYERGILTSSSSSHANSKLGKGASHENLLDYHKGLQGHDIEEEELEEEEEVEDDEDQDQDNDHNDRANAHFSAGMHNHAESMAVDAHNMQMVALSAGAHADRDHDHESGGSMSAAETASSIELGMKFHRMVEHGQGPKPAKEIATSSEQRQLIGMLDGPIGGGGQPSFFSSSGSGHEPPRAHYSASQTGAQNTPGAAAGSLSNGPGLNDMQASHDQLQQQQQQQHMDKYSIDHTKSLQVEMFVKDILNLQQQQHQKLVEEYDRMEQAHELRDELEKQQQQHHNMKPSNSNNSNSHHHHHQHHHHHHQHDMNTNTSQLMAFVHKLGGGSASHDDSSTSTSHDLMSHAGAPSNSVSRIH